MKELYQFKQACCGQATTPEDLKRAGTLFADAVGKIGVNALLGLLGVKAAKGLKFKAGGGAAVAGTLDEATIARIKAMPKGSRPDPSTYMSQEAIDEHLAKFDDGASRFTLKSSLDKNGPAQKDGTSFVMPKSEADNLLHSAGGDKQVLEQSLGLPEGQLDGNTLVRIDVADPKSLGLKIPSGNEAGANSQWIPGGLLPSGNSEAIIDLGNANPSTYVTTLMR